MQRYDLGSNMRAAAKLPATQSKNRKSFFKVTTNLRGATFAKVFFLSTELKAIIYGVIFSKKGEK